MSGVSRETTVFLDEGDKLTLTRMGSGLRISAEVASDHGALYDRTTLILGAEQVEELTRFLLPTLTEWRPDHARTR